MHIYWTDLETTGLDPQKDQILEIAIAKSTLDDPFNTEVIFDRAFRLPFEASELSPFILDMHTKNGLLVECAKASQFAFQVEKELLELIPPAETDPETGRPGLHALAGNSIHFDLGFLRAHLPAFAKRFSHRLYDVSAVGLFCRSLGMPKFKKAEAHRAKDDILESIEMARSCAQWLRKVPPPMYSIGEPGVLGVTVGLTTKDAGIASALPPSGRMHPSDPNRPLRAQFERENSIDPLTGEKL